MREKPKSDSKRRHPLELMDVASWLEDEDEVVAAKSNGPAEAMHLD